MHENTFTLISSVILSFLSYCFGINPAIEFLLWCVILDVVIGTLSSFVNQNTMFNSRKMFKGLAKKLILLSMIAFSHQLDILMHTDMICMTTTYFFIVNESLSVLENCGKCGVKLPKIIENSLEQIKELNKINEHKNN